MNDAKLRESAASAGWAEPGEELRAEFEREYGRDRKRKDANGQDYGQWLDLHRLPPDDRGWRPYRSMVTAYAWLAFRHGRGALRPNYK